MRILADFSFLAIVCLRPDGASEALSRIDSLTGENRSSGDVAFDGSTSSAISSSFQGTDTSSVQNELRNQTAAEDSSPEKRLPGIEKAIDRLFRLSLMIRQPSRSSQIEKAEAFTMLDDDGNSINEAFAGYARQIVEHCFPDAPEFLRAKLSEGIVIRRKRFLYRQSHQKKLSREEKSKSRKKDDLTYGDRFQETDTTVRASKLTNETPTRPRQPKTSDPSHTSASAIQKQILSLNEALEDTRSTKSVAFTATPSSSAPIELPRPPKPTPGSKEFECPYCCLMLPINDSKASHWRYVGTRSIGSSLRAKLFSRPKRDQLYKR